MEAPRNSSKDPWKDRAGPRARARCAGKPETARRPNGGRGRLVAAAHVHARFRGRAEFRAVGETRPKSRCGWVRVTFPPKMGPIPPEIMYFLCIVTCFDVSAMYLKCISSVVFGAFGRLVSLCIVYVSSVHSHVSFLCLVPSFMLLY